jgi:hypothetical protein
VFSKKVWPAALALAIIGAIAAPLPAAFASTPPNLTYTPVPNWWGTNGRVTDIVPMGDRVYLAGGFDYIGPQTGYGTAVDGASGVSLSGAPVIDGTVYASAPDGAGGWYVAGSFTTVGGVARANAAHITATGAVTNWNPKPDATVRALAVTGSEVLLGGDFGQIGKTPVPANHLGAVDLTAGSAISGFSASTDGSVRALLTAGTNVYVGGDFGTVDGTSHSRLAAINASNGSLTNFAGQANGAVRALTISPDGNTLYAGGDFSSAYDGAWQNRSRLAAWSTANGTLQPWAPNANDSVEALAVNPATGVVYAGGLFSSVSGTARTRLASIDSS